jgi:hypothetical protein
MIVSLENALVGLALNLDGDHALLTCDQTSCCNHLLVLPRDEGQGDAQCLLSITV